MASTIGTIMAVVAVLEIHMDRNMVGSMKPSISSRGLVPDGFFLRLHGFETDIGCEGVWCGGRGRFYEKKTFIFIMINIIPDVTN